MAGTISGIVLVGGLLLERSLRSRDARLERRQELIARVLGSYVEAIARNVRTTDAEVRSASGSRIAAAHAQLLTFGSPAIADALARFDQTSMNLGDVDARNALLALLQTIRAEVLPGEPEVSLQVMEKVLLEAPSQ